jgi:lysine 2,3-aminomutase
MHLAAERDCLSAGTTDLADWRWQLRRSVRTADELARALSLTAEEFAGAQAAEKAGFPIAITPYYLSLCDPTDAKCPIRRQVVPRRQEGELVAGDLRDPLGEEAHEVAPDLVQRYPDRALILVSDRCAVYCRFCTRSRLVGSGGGPRSLERLKPALEYIRAHPEIREVIVSGGDPLVMSTDRLTGIIAAIRAIPSVETIRLATRVPVTLPQRITDELVAALRQFHPIWVMTHFNHPKELTPQSRLACSRLVDSGFPINNQTVLLLGINDVASTLEELFRALVRERVRPTTCCRPIRSAELDICVRRCRRASISWNNCKGVSLALRCPNSSSMRREGSAKCQLAPTMWSRAGMDLLASGLLAV